MSEAFAPLRLKRNEERRLRTGHLWIYSNEIDNEQTPLSGFEPGQPVEIQGHSGKFLGTGYVNPHSLIAARLVSRDRDHPLCESLLVHRIKVALSLREMLFPKPYYRLLFGESDGVPGVVVDRFDTVLVVQITTAGMERMKGELLAALEKVLKPTAVLWRNDSSIRTLEGLESYVEPAAGEVPELVALEENGVRFEAPIVGGQKTGWFFDHRMNRARLAPYVQGKRVLDVFSYIGGWGVQAAAFGAAEVSCIDSSSSALDLAHHNAELNGVADRFIGIEGDAFEALKALRQEREHYDVVILDPPAFIKRKKDFKQGVEGYRRLNQLGMQVLAKDGILVSASCSHHLPQQKLQELMLQSAVHLDRNLQITELGQQGPDHPLHPAIPESGYIKAIFSRVLRR